MKQVITVTPEGVIEGLQHKKGRGMDLRQFGEADIQRASEIVWVAGHSQKWVIRLMVGVLNGAFVTPKSWQLMTGKEWTGDTLPGLTVALGEVLAFDDYDDAVAAEIEYLDAVRITGRSHLLRDAD